MHLILRIIINAAALAFAATFVSGFTVSGIYAALVAAIVLGILNALVRPVLIFFTLPVTILTLGLFIFVINALMVALMASIVKGIEVTGFLPAMMVALILWAISTLTNWLLVDRSEK